MDKNDLYTLSLYKEVKRMDDLILIYPINKDEYCKAVRKFINNMDKRIKIIEIKINLLKAKISINENSENSNILSILEHTFDLNTHKEIIKFYNHLKCIYGEI